MIDSIRAWHDRLRDVVILRRDAFRVIDAIHDDAGTVVFCDPPYLTKSSAYVHDFAPADHARLATALARFTQARVIVSYYDDERLDELYPGWKRRRIEVSKGLTNTSGNGKRAVEVLLTNSAAVDRDIDPLIS